MGNNFNDFSHYRITYSDKTVEFRNRNTDVDRHSNKDRYYDIVDRNKFSH